MKKVLVTGNLGYIGSTLVDLLLKKNYFITGLDTNYYSRKIEKKKNFNQIIKDIRDLSFDDLKDHDYVIHLAALSNDPLGDFDSRITKDINYKATIKLAKYAKKIGISKFIFLSTQSIYGISSLNKELKEDASKKNPITHYAKTKWKCEKFLKKISTKKFNVIFLRPSTVFGSSKNFRSDIILNNFITQISEKNLININSNGLAWRPLVHVKDLSRVIIKFIDTDLRGFNAQAFNVGLSGSNIRVIDLAIMVQKFFKNSKVIILNKNKNDERSYKVSFDKIYKIFGNKLINTEIDTGITELEKFVKKQIKYNHNNFKLKSNRINMLKNLIKKRKINSDLRFN